MRSPIAAIFSALTGIVFAVPGVLLALWVGTTLYKVERGFDLAMWAAHHSPLPLTVSPLELANGAIQRESLIGLGIASLILCAIGFNALVSARRLLRPADESSDGKARIVFKTATARVGRPLEGRLELAEDANPGDVFRLDIICARRYRVDSEKTRERTETAFFERQEVKAVPGAHGCSLPFRFEIPVTAPPSGATDGFRTGAAYYWRLEFDRAGEFSFSSSWFDLELAAAPPEELRAVEASESAGQKEAIDTIAAGLGRGPLLPHQRAQLRALSSEDLAMARKVSSIPGKVMKWMPVAIVLMFLVPVVVFIVGAIAVLLLS